MTNAASNQMNQWEQKYHDITELYALADALLETVEQSANPEMQLGLVEHLVETIGESTDVLTEEYVGLCQTGAASKKSAKSKVEGALRKLYIAMSDFSTRARDTKNAAHQIFKKIKRQLEQVICNFVEMMQLSLDRIMQKHDVDDLKSRHASIALMLYSANGPGQSN